MNSNGRIGWTCGILSYVLWGTLPFYWKGLVRFSNAEIIAYRYVGCVLFFGLLALGLATKHGLKKTFMNGVNRKNLGLLSISSLLVGVNWYGYVMAVNSGHVVEAGLGYYINPILNVVIGTLILKERLNRAQWMSVGSAAFGVLWLFTQSGASPWISIFLAVTFTAYGLVRKKVNMTVVVASFWETLLLLPVALAFLVLLFERGRSYLPDAHLHELVLLFFIGVVTGLPLVLFAKALRLLPLSLVSFIQYISPTLQFLFGIFLFHEVFDLARLQGFLFIWIAVFIFLFDAWRQSRLARML